MATVKTGSSMTGDFRVQIGGIQLKQQSSNAFASSQVSTKDFTTEFKLGREVDAWSFEFQLVQSVPKLNGLETLKRIEVFGPALRGHVSSKESHILPTQRFPIIPLHSV